MTMNNVLVNTYAFVAAPAWRAAAATLALSSSASSSAYTLYLIYDYFNLFSICNVGVYLSFLIPLCKQTLCDFIAQFTLNGKMSVILSLQIICKAQNWRILLYRLPLLLRFKVKVVCSLRPLLLTAKSVKPTYLRTTDLRFFVGCLALQSILIYFLQLDRGACRAWESWWQSFVWYPLFGSCIRYLYFTYSLWKFVMLSSQ